jgi:hypothetical protein
MRQDVNKVKKYASDLQTFIGVNEMTRVLDGEAKKQKGACNYELFANLETSFTKDSNFDEKSSFISKSS